MKRIPTAKDIRDGMLNVFKTTTDTRGAAVLGAIVPHTFDPRPALCPSPDYEAEETCSFVNQFKAYVGHESGAPEKTRFRLVVYCHILEAETPHAVIWNLLRLIGGEQSSWDFSTPGKKGNQPCEFPEQRVAQIKLRAESLGQPIGGVLDDLWHNKLRNAFLHAQYALLSDGSFVGTKTISPLTANAVRKSDKPDTLGNDPTHFTASEIEQLFDASLEYLWAFTECYKMASKPFKDGAFHPFPTGPIRWNQDPSRNWWSTT